MVQILRHFLICIATVKSLQPSQLFQTILLNYYFWNAFINPERKNYMWNLWYPNYKKQYCPSQEELFCWYIVFILKNREDGGFRYFYAHENNTLLDRSKLLCTHDDLAKLKEFLNQTDVIEFCSRERMSTKWRFYKLTNLTVFAALFKDVHMGCKNAVLREPLLRNGTINCLTFEESTREPYNDNLCLFRALVLHLHGTQRLDEETSNLCIFLIKKMDGLSPNQFQGVHMNDIPIVEDLLTLSILLYDIEIVDANIVGEHARRSVQKYQNTVRLLRHNNHICYVNNINAVFQSFRCTNCDTFFNRTFNLERHSTTCGERVKNVYPRNVYQLGETLFDKLDSFGIKYKSEQKLFNNLAIFDFESICVQEETFRDKNTTTWIGKHVPISVSISSNLVEEPIFNCSSNPHHLVASFIGAVENLASQSRAKMKNFFFNIETTIQYRLNWATSWRNILNVIIDENKHIWMIVITKIVPHLNSYRYKKIN